MLEKILQMLRMACPHKNMSHPFAAASRSQTTVKSDWETVGSAGGSGHYVVCLDCGRKFNYDWANMKVVK
ncbi:MAG TPA: hypothetical protein VD837_11230 [Terriglobales bacterium]|nr:hypothetical protein [Terriglobales bacterium]